MHGPTFSDWKCKSLAGLQKCKISRESNQNFLTTMVNLALVFTGFPELVESNLRGFKKTKKQPKQTNKKQNKTKQKNFSMLQV